MDAITDKNMDMAKIDDKKDIEIKKGRQNYIKTVV